MRRFPLAVLLLVGCGGSDNGPTPPPPSGVPSSAVVQAGDHQEAVPGTAVPVTPSILVRDGSGQPVSGVAVTFAVDSGGGTVTGASATTGSNGVAAIGGWTLGPAEGQNVLRATVTGLTAPVKIRALGKFPPALDQQSVGAGGGKFRVDRPGHPLNGLELTVPAGSYPGTTQWTIATAPGVSMPLPVGAVQIGPAIRIANGQNYADQLITIRIPARVSFDTAVAAMFYDPDTHVMEAVPVVARDSASIVILSRHFSRDFLLTPKSPGPSLRRAAAPDGPIPFGDVTLIVYGMPFEMLIGDVSTSFAPGMDDFEFDNYGSLAAPAGHCAGQVIAEMYYHYRVREGGGPPLFHQFDEVANYWPDNPRGIRFASAVQHDFDYVMTEARFQIDQKLISRGTEPHDKVVFQSVMMALIATHRPQLLTLSSGTVTDTNHAVLVYGGGDFKLAIADPNHVGQLRQIQYDPIGESFVAYELSLAAGEEPRRYPFFDLFGVSSVIPMIKLDARWSQFLAGIPGVDLYPDYVIEVQNPFDETWSEVKDELRTTSANVVLRSRCPDCPVRWVADRQPLIIVDHSGNFVNSDRTNPDIGVRIRLNQDSVRAGVYALALSKASPQQEIEYLDHRWINLIKISFGVRPACTASPVAPSVRRAAAAATTCSATLTGLVDSTYRFVAHHEGLAKSGSKFTWTFGDGTAPVVISDSTVDHAFHDTGTFTVKAELKDKDGKILARDSTTAKIVPPQFVWAFQSITLESSALPPGGIGPERSDTLIFNTVTKIMADLQAHPENSSFFVSGIPTAGPSCHSVAGLQQFPAGQVADTVSGEHVFAVLGICGDEDITGTITMGTLGNGTITGTANGVANGEVITLPGGTVEATMHDKELTGTFVWLVRYSNGQGSYTVSFRALQVRP